MRLRRYLALGILGVVIAGSPVHAQDDQPAFDDPDRLPAAPALETEPPPDAPDPAGNAAPPTAPPDAAQLPYSPAPAGEGSVPTPPSDPFQPPPGLVTPPEILIPSVGFYGHFPFVYSPSNCFDLAMACYHDCFYLDAIALLSHAIEQDPQPHYYYLRGMAEMQVGLAEHAIVSADGVLAALDEGRYGGLDPVRERFNGPKAVQFRELLVLREATPGREG